MSIDPTVNITPQIGVFNVQTDTLFALNINGSIQDKLKEIFEAIKTHEGGRIRNNKQFYSLVQSVIKSNLCHRTTTTRIGFGLFERKTDINNHLIR